MATTEGEGFLGRWSRLKRGDVPAEAEPGEAARGPGDESAAVVAEPQAPALPPPDLPPIESLGAGSDYAAFLAEGVPEELRRLALRRAWTSDPRIANFRGFADYDWDYNAPGYGRLLPIDDVKRLCEAILGREEADEAPKPAPETGVLEAELSAPPEALPGPAAEDVATAAVASDPGDPPGGGRDNGAPI